MPKKKSGSSHPALPQLAIPHPQSGPTNFIAIRLLLLLGPGLITGAADDDPSGIATYSQVGAQFGFGMLWTMLFSLSADGSYPGNQRAHRPRYRARASPPISAGTNRNRYSTR